MKEFGERSYTARELEAITGADRRVINRRASREDWPHEEEAVRGGRRRLYRHAGLPPDIAVKIERADAAGSAAELGEGTAAGKLPAERSDEIWKSIEASTLEARAKGSARAAALRKAERLKRRFGLSFADAARLAAEGSDFSASSIQRWHKDCSGWPAGDWPALLVDKPRPGRPQVEIPEIAWKAYQREYLRRHGPTREGAHERTRREFAARCPGVPLPPLKTFQRRIEKEYTPQEIVQAREGTRAAAMLAPRMDIDRSALEAGTHVSMDGVQFSGIYVDCGDGKPTDKITGWFCVDMLTGFPMAYRLAPSETTTLIRLTAKDLIAKWGIPDFMQVDSTMAAASKTLSGRAKHKPFRGKISPGDPEGVLIVLGIDVATTHPPGDYNQAGSKLAERLFGIGGLPGRVRKHSLMEGRGTSTKNPVDLDHFRNAVEISYREHVEKPGRRGQNVGGKSLEKAFLEEREGVEPKWATPEQLALLDCEVKRVRVAAARGEFSIQLPGGKMARHYYSHPSLLRFRKQHVYAYYNPADMALPVRVVDADSKVICAEVARRPGAKFRDKDAGQRYQKHLRREVKANKQSLAAKLARAEIEGEVYRSLDAPGPELPELGIAAAPALPAEPAAALAADGTSLVHDKDEMRRMILEAGELNRQQREELEAPLAIPVIGGGNE